VVSAVDLQQDVIFHLCLNHVFIPCEVHNIKNCFLFVLTCILQFIYVLFCLSLLLFNDVSGLCILPFLLNSSVICTDDVVQQYKYSIIKRKPLIRMP